MTLKEKAFIYKAWETKTVSDTSYIANAVNNAIGNALRKKGQKAFPLWKKKQKQLNKDTARQNLDMIRSIEKAEGKQWVEEIYRVNRIRKKGGA